DVSPRGAHFRYHRPGVQSAGWSAQAVTAHPRATLAPLLRSSTSHPGRSRRSQEAAPQAAATLTPRQEASVDSSGIAPSSSAAPAAASWRGRGRTRYRLSFTGALVSAVLESTATLTFEVAYPHLYCQLVGSHVTLHGSVAY